MLQGNGFIIRNWKTGDAVSLQRNADNPNVSAFLTDRFPCPYTMEAAEFWVEMQQKQDPLINFAISIDDEVVGGIGIEIREDVYRKTGLIGYWLAEKLWGKGIITEALILVTDYAFNNLGLIRLQAGVLSKNTSSMRVLEKAGYIKEAILRRAIIKRGEIMDEHVYAILK